MFGGCCKICGYNRCLRALEFHHVDPKVKAFSLSLNSGVTQEKLVDEAMKCVLLCANCHREVEAGVVILPFAKLDNG
jgi:hypothetical protein